MEYFKTQTNRAYAAKKALKQMVLTFLALSICCLFALRIHRNAFLLCEAACAGVCVILYLTSRNRNWTLEFIDDEFDVINNITGERYHFYATPASDCVLRQTKAETTKNLGTLKIKHTIFSHLPALENAAEMKAYIQEHLSKYG